MNVISTWHAEPQPYGEHGFERRPLRMIDAFGREAAQEDHEPLGAYAWLIRTPAQVRTPPDLERQFAELAVQWRIDAAPISSSRERAMLPSYQRVVGLGWAVVPLIIQELRREPQHWFWALRAITGEDPVPDEARGKVPEMAQAWIDWAEERGISQG